MTNLKPCPCGKTPTHVIEDPDGVYGDCCYAWTSAVDGHDNKEERWNAAARAVPVACPQCEGEGVVTAPEALLNGELFPTIPCPTCAPFGGRGAIMVPESEVTPNEVP